jgi:hypothetical protein
MAGNRGCKQHSGAVYHLPRTTIGDPRCLADARADRGSQETCGAGGRDVAGHRSAVQHDNASDHAGQQPCQSQPAARRPGAGHPRVILATDKQTAPAWVRPGLLIQQVNCMRSASGSDRRRRMSANAHQQEIDHLRQSLTQVETKVFLAPDDQLLIIEALKHLSNQLGIDSRVDLTGALGAADQEHGQPLQTESAAGVGREM